MKRFLILPVAATAVMVLGTLAAWSDAGRSHAASGEVPANLVPPEGQVQQAMLVGIGAQVYACQESATAASGYAWTFTAPAAVLLDDAGTIAGTHFGGPTWQATDGSSVAATVVERVPSSDPSAVPWLLLQATAVDTSGAFGGVAYIQRLETTGGLAPAEGCDAEHVGAIARVPYTAAYVFYGTP